MNENKSQEHSIKETLKTIVDNSPNYSNQVKQEIKAIIDASNTPEEILMATFSYFFMFPLR